MEPAKHIELATLDLRNGWFVGVCDCGWTSPNVQGSQRATEAVRVHVLLRVYDASVRPSSGAAA